MTHIDAYVGVFRGFAKWHKYSSKEFEIKIKEILEEFENEVKTECIGVIKNVNSKFLDDCYVGNGSTSLRQSIIDAILKGG